MKRRCAAFTIVQNEPRFLPLWSHHYRKLVGPENVFVLDHDSENLDSVAAAMTCNRVPVHRSESFNHQWLLSVVSSFQRFLLQSYDWVLFAESDEFVVFRGVYPIKVLLDALEAVGFQSVVCRGYEVIQNRDEKPIDWGSLPILKQRHWWAPSQLYSKPALSSLPTEWGMGFHYGQTPGQVRHSTELFMLHFHRLDYAYCQEKHRLNVARKWSEDDLRHSRGLQNRIVENASFQQWFYHPEQVSDLLEPLPLEPIPEDVKELI